MNRFNISGLRARLIVCVALVTGAPPTKAEIGHLLFVYGDLTVVSKSGTSRAGTKNLPIEQGDTILSVNGGAQVRMVDGAMVIVRENSEIRFDRYKFESKARESDDALLSIVKGGLRSITGLLGQRSKEKYKVATPTATIGIRGTDKEIRVVLPPAPGGQPIAPPGTYAKLNVQVGNPSQLLMANAAGGITISPNQVGFSPSTGSPPVILPSIPPFLAGALAPQPAAKKAAAAPAAKSQSAGPAGGTQSSQQGASSSGENQQASSTGSNESTASNQGGSNQAQSQPSQQGASGSGLSQQASSGASGESGATGPGGPTQGQSQIASAQQTGAATSTSAPPEGAAALSPVPVQSLTTAGVSTVVSAPEPPRVVAVPTTVEIAGAAIPLSVTPVATLPATQSAVIVPLPTPQITTLTTVTASTTTSSGTVQTLSETTQTLTQGNLVYDVVNQTTTDSTTGVVTSAGTSVSGSQITITQDYGLLAEAESVLVRSSYDGIAAVLAVVGGADSVLSASSLSSLSSGYLGTTGVSGSIAGDASVVAGLASINLSLSASNFTSATTAKNTADALVGNSTSGVVKFYTDNATFRDSQAAAAYAAMNSANQSLQATYSALNTEKLNADSSASSLTSYQSLAAAKKTSADTKLLSLQSLVTQISSIDIVLSGKENIALSMSDLLATVSTVLADANNYTLQAKTAQAAGDYTSAATMYEAAKTERIRADNLYAIAQKLQSVITDKNTLATLQSELASLLVNANASKQSGDQSVILTTSKLAELNTYLTQVQQQAVVAQYTNPANATTERFGHVVFGSKSESPESALSSVAQTRANTSYVLDGGRNLVELKNAPFISQWLSVPDIDYSSANIKISGGTANESSGNTFVDSSNGSIYYGRWAGPTLTVDNQAGTVNTYALGSQSLHWLIGYSPAENYARSLQGTASYSLVGNTKPTDMAGNLGALSSASLSANFNSQQVTAAVNVDIASKSLALTTATMSIGVNNTFSQDYATVSCSGAGCGSSYWDGRLSGQFFGANALYAGLGYRMNTMNSTYTGLGDSIQGVALFKTDSAPELKYGINLVHGYLAYSYSSGSYLSSPLLTRAESYSIAPYDYTLASVSGGTYPLHFEDGERSVSVNAPVSVGYSTVALNGGEWATYGRGEPQGATNVELQVLPIDSAAGAYQKISGPYSWVSGPYASSPFAPFALTTTATYQFGGGWVENNGGGAGTYDPAATSLTVDFNRQKVALNISGVVPFAGSNVNFTLSHPDMGLVGESFSSSSANYDAQFSASINGSGQLASSLSGSLLGTGLQGAGVSFSISDHSNTGGPSAIGSVVFKAGTTQTLEPFHVGLMAVGTSFAEYVSNPGDLSYMVRPAVTTASRAVFTANGYFKTFDTSLPKNISNTSMFPMQLGFVETALVDMGSDAATGITWGRYSPGGSMENVIMLERTSSTPTYSSRSSMGPTGEGWHAIFSAVQNSVPSIPITGYHAYTFAGGTLPTDTNGYIASVVPTATLNADFSKQVVHVTVPQFSLKDSAGAVQSTWSANTTSGGVPIVRGSYFGASTGAGNLAVTSTATGTVSGRLGGVFVGDFNAAGAGAMIGYSLNAGGSSGTTVSGVSAFRK